MRGISVFIVTVLAALRFGPALDAAAQAGSPAPGATARAAVVTARVSGTFEVKLTPGGKADAAGGESIGRMSIDKRFHGELEATSKGEMLSAMTAISGSAGYVAIEKVTGTLAGRSGTFVLQHSGTRTRGAPELSVTVVPDSGTGQLVGLAGKMSIRIEDGKHFYDFEYSLPQVP